MPRRLFRIGGWLLSAAALGSLFLPGGEDPARLATQWQILLTVVGAVLHGVRAVRSQGAARRVWSLTAAGLACWALAVISVPLPVAGDAPGRDPLTDLLTLTACVVAVLALLIGPAVPPTAAGRLRLALDAVAATAALIGVAWVTLLGSDGDFDLAYATVVVGVCAVAFLLLAAPHRRNAGAIRTVAGGVLLTSLTLLVEVTGPGWLQSWAPAGYVLAAALIASAALYDLPRRPEAVTEPVVGAAVLLPYLPVALYAVVAVGPAFAGHALEPAAIGAGALMVGALLARQFLTIRRTAALTEDLAAERARFATEAVHDALTGLPNRALLNRQLAEAGENTVLLMIDLDGFKAVNDTLGHPAGDALLIMIADRIRDSIAPYADEATGARLGGDEFAVLLRAGGLDRARDLARTLLERCAEPVPLDGRTATVRASIGIAVHTAGVPTSRLLHEADLALYEAKNNGKGQFRLFDEKLSAAVAEQHRLEAELGGALAEGEFELFFQPVVDLSTGSTVAVEESLRWRHPRLGLLEPEAFMPAAADAGLLPEIDRFVVTSALRQLAVWRRTQPRLRLAMYLSARYLKAGTAVEDLERGLAAHGLPGAALMIRLSDSSSLAEIEPLLRDVRALGVRIGLDDFGFGQGALADLGRLRVSEIRLSPLFLTDLAHSPEAATLLGAVIARAESMGISCLAGGVETADHEQRLRRLGCRWAQGPLYGNATAAAGLPPQAPVTVGPSSRG